MPAEDVAQTTADAFEVLANEHRLDVLLALLRAQERTDLPYPIAFAALHDETGVDYSSQLSYHLEVLVPEFVEKRAAGYALTVAGAAIAWFVRSDVLDDHTVRDDIRAVGACYRCGEPALAGTYEDYQFHLDCEACGEPVLRTAIRPPAVRDRDDAEVLDVVDCYVRERTRLLAAETCPQCYGTVEGELVEGVRGGDGLQNGDSHSHRVHDGDGHSHRVDDGESHSHRQDAPVHARDSAQTDGGSDDGEDAVADERPGLAGYFGGEGAGGGHVRYRCRDCGHVATMPAGRRAAVDPRVRRFFADRGVSLEEGRLWDYPFCVDQRHGRFRELDREAFLLELAADGSTIYAEVDANGSVETSTTDPSALTLN